MKQSRTPVPYKSWFYTFFVCVVCIWNHRNMWFTIFGWLLTVITILANSFVAYLVITRPRLHGTANWFILSLALADLFVGLTYFPPLFISRFFQDLAIDHTGVWFKVSHTFLYSSSTNLCALTVDRFMAITMHLKYNHFMSRRIFSLFIALAWISPLVIFTLPSIFTYSSGNESFTFAFENIRVLIFQLIPCVLFVYVIGRLCLITRDISRKEAFILHQIRFNSTTQENTQSIKDREKKTASVKMIIFIISLFVLCHVAGNYRCFCFVFKFCVVPEALEKAVHLLFLMNSAVNPLVYAVPKKDIKRELKKIGFFKCR